MLKPPFPIAEINKAEYFVFLLKPSPVAVVTLILYIDNDLPFPSPIQPYVIITIPLVRPISSRYHLYAH